MANFSEKDIQDLNAIDIPAQQIQNKISPQIPQQATQPQEQNLLNTLANNPITDYIISSGESYKNLLQGLLTGLATLPYESGQLINSALGLQKLPELPKPSGETGTLGNIIGETMGFIGGGEALDAMRVASKAIPYVSKATAGLEGTALREALKRAMGGSLYGAITSPEDRGSGAAIGGAISFLPEALGLGIKKTFSNIIPKIMPSEISKNIENILSPAEINKRKNIGQDLFKDIFSSIPENKLIETPSYNTLLKIKNKVTKALQRGDEETIYKSEFLSPSLEAFLPSSLKKVHNLFVSNPTAKNAHSLYKQYGSEIAKYDLAEAKAGRLDAAQSILRDTFKIGRKNIRNDLENYLASENPQLVKNFKDVNKYYNEEVYPYEKLSLLFRSLNKEPSSEKILKALSNKESLLSDIEARTGRQQYFPKEISAMLPELKKRIETKELFQKGVGALGGGALGHLVMPSTEVLTGLLGLHFMPSLSKTLSKTNIKIGDKSKEFANILKKALIANLASGE